MIEKTYVNKNGINIHIAPDIECIRCWSDNPYVEIYLNIDSIKEADNMCIIDMLIPEDE